MLSSSLDRRGVWGRMDTYICMAESLCCSPETITTLLISCVVVQLPSRVQLFVTPWTAAQQASLSITNSWSLPKFMFIALVMPSSHLILWLSLLLLPLIFPSIRTFPMSWLFASDDQNTGTSASASVLPVNIQDWFLLRLISLLSKGLFRSLLQHHSSTTSILWHSAFFFLESVFLRSIDTYFPFGHHLSFLPPTDVSLCPWIIF